MTSQITEYSKTEAALAELRTELSDVVFDVSTPGGMKEAKAARMRCVKSRTGLEKIRVEIKAPALARTQAIDTEARRITAEIVKLEEPITAQIKIEEDRLAAIKEEAERKEREAAEEAAKTEREAKEKYLRQILAIKSRPLDFIGAAPDVILVALEKARGAAMVLPGRFPEELHDECVSAFDSAIKQMEQMHIDALNRVDLEQRAASAPELSEPDNTPTGDPLPQAPVLEPARSPEVKPAPVESAESVIADITNDDVPPFTPDPEPTPISELIKCAKAVVNHYGKFKSPHASVIALDDAIKTVESV